LIKGLGTGKELLLGIKVLELEKEERKGWRGKYGMSVNEKRGSGVLAGQATNRSKLSLGKWIEMGLRKS